MACFILAGLGVWMVEGKMGFPLRLEAHVIRVTVLSLVALTYVFIDLARAGNLAETVHSFRDFMMPLIIVCIGISVGSRPGFRRGTFLDCMAALLLPVMVLGIYQSLRYGQADLTQLGLIDGRNREYFLFLRTDANGTPLPGIRCFGVFDSPLGMSFACLLAIWNSWIARKVSRGEPGVCTA